MVFIDYNFNKLGKKYRRNMHLYLGKHSILSLPDKETGADNRIVVNMPKYLVDTYNGFFSGIAPKISLDNEQANDILQSFNDSESFFDKLNEISKQADIYGRSIAFVYQGEDSKPHISFSSPSHAFIIYDDTVARKPLAFVRYTIADGKSYTEAVGQIQYADHLFNFEGNRIEVDTETNTSGINPYGIVPAVEFYENEERQGIFDGVVTLINSLDKAMSQKANQVEYFDNAYLAAIGIRFEENEDGTPKIDLKNNRLLYIPTVDPNSPNPRLEFLSKPDADQIQEHLIDKLTNDIFQMAMIPNLNDEAFSGNSSGVALNYKLLPMRNKAASKERKFTKHLRALYQIIFTVLFSQSQQNLWSELNFQFIRNLPANIADEVNSARNAEGIVSKETQLSLLSFVSDPKAEINKIEKEKEDNIKQVQALVMPTDELKKVNDSDEPDGEVDGQQVQDE